MISRSCASMMKAPKDIVVPAGEIAVGLRSRMDERPVAGQYLARLPDVDKYFKVGFLKRTGVASRSAEVLLLNSVFNEGGLPRQPRRIALPS